MHHDGNLIVRPNNLEYAKTVTSVGGYLWIRAKCDLPALQTVGGNLPIETECVPVLQTVGGKLSIKANCNLPALQTVGGYLWIRAKCNLPALTVAHGVPGRLIAISNYGLWLGDDGLYYAGCRQGLTKDQAINHWIDREDERALKFIGAILAN